MKQEIIGYLLGDVSLGFLCAFFIFALGGVLFSMLLHFKRKQKKKKIPFNLSYWILDNIVRFFTSIIIIFLAVRFYNELPIQLELNMFLGFAIGVTLDQVIIYIRRKTNLNIFQKL